MAHLTRPAEISGVSAGSFPEIAAGNLAYPGRGTLCCVLGQDTSLSQRLSPPRCINGYRQNAGGNPAMD